MKNWLSQRDFMAKGAAALGVSAAYGLTGLLDAGHMTVAEAQASEGSREETMPHIIVKLWPGSSEDAKQQLADAIVEDVVNIAGCKESSVTVAIEEVPSEEWKEKVYEPEIKARM